MVGSTWKKWDLHLHAPGTAKNDQYGDVTLEQFCEELVRSEISAVGITDYFSVESAFKVKQTLKERSSSIEVFPNIELRDSRTPGNTRLNFHVVFSNELSEESVKQALARVPVEVSGQLSRYLHDLEREDIQYALADIRVVREELSKSFNGEEPFLIIAASGNDGYRPKGKSKDWSPMARTEAETIIRASHAVFGNENDARYWTKPTDFDQLPRPVFCGSDAHELKNIKAHSDSQRCTWIKGEVSFVGLRETLIEPSSRVRIQKFCPEDKDPARVIESISITSNTEGWKKKFNQTIHLNPALNSIIGARSSGKSIFAAALAYACSPSRTISAQERVSPAAIKRGNGDPAKVLGPAGSWSWNEFSNEVNLSLRWGNGDVSTPDSAKGSLTYLPQGYLNSLAEDPKEIQRLLKKAIQSPPTNKTLVKYRESLNFLHESVDEIKSLVDKIFETRDNLEKINAESSSLGELNNLNKRKEELTAKQSQLAGANLSDEDKNKLTEHLEASQKISSWTSLDAAKEKAILSRAVDSHRRPLLSEEVEITLGGVLDREWAAVLENFRHEAGNLLDTFCHADSRALEETTEHRDRWSSELKEKNGGVLPSRESEEAKNIERDLSKVSSDISSLWRANSEASDLQKTLDECTSQLSSLRTEYLAMVHELMADEGEIGTKIENIEVGIDFGYPLEEFPSCDHVNKNKDVAVWATYCDYLDELVDGGREGFPQFDELFAVIMNSTLKLRVGTEQRRASLASDIASFLPVPRLYGRYDNDRFGGFEESGMSAGKRALAGLTLLLADESSAGPLILDQPEDDLDSRSIAESIVPYLRNTKLKRQVIIVSHNANLVVGADSELVLVANQGSRSYKNTEGLMYFYGAGSLESSALEKSSRFYFESASVKEHICDLLDGGIESFEKRARRYR